MTTMMSSNVDVNDKLAALSEKQKEWRELSAEAKLDLLNQVHETIMNSVGHKGFLEMANRDLQMMGMPSDTLEGQTTAAEIALLSASCIKQILLGYKQAYEVRTGKSEIKDTSLIFSAEKSTTGQVKAVVNPENPAIQGNMFAKGATCEIYFSKDVSDISLVKPFQFEYFDKKKDGVMVVLGAGNWDMLAVCDVLNALFVRNQVVFLKHHPLRGASLEPFVRKALDPLFERGFLQSECDRGSERSSQIVYSPHVTSVHLTGGKPTHDAIVWGNPDEQAERKAANNPKLSNAEMTSELGAVTPWIVPPAEYSDEQLEHLARTIDSAVYNNASANCNSPKCVIMSKTWRQGPKFQGHLLDIFSRFETPCAYYPGSKERWEATKENMASTQIVESKSKLTNEDRQLKTPMFGKEGPVTLPLLSIDVDIDLSTEKGREEASNQYLFQKEPFCPVICFAKITDDDGNIDRFLETAVTFANDYLFGTLSASMTFPPSLEDHDAVEKAVADLQYGSVVTNAWSASTFGAGLPWGGYAPKESLEAIESGLGSVADIYLFPHVVKSVLKTPIVSPTHYLKTDEPANPEELIGGLQAVLSATI